MGPFPKVRAAVSAVAGTIEAIERNVDPTPPGDDEFLDAIDALAELERRLGELQQAAREARGRLVARNEAGAPPLVPFLAAG